MQQLALLSGASPLTCKVAPTVRLQAGTWELAVDGLVDSILVLHRLSHPGDTPITVSQCRSFQIFDATNVRLEFTNRGTERFITVNAKRII